MPLWECVTVIVLDISQLDILWKTIQGINTESLIRNKLILKALARRTLNLSPARAVGEAAERNLKYSRGGKRTGDVFARHHLPSSAGTKATRGRPSASCLHYSCVKHLPLFLAQRGRAKMKQKRGYTVPKQRESPDLHIPFMGWPRPMLCPEGSEETCPISGVLQWAHPAAVGHLSATAGNVSTRRTSRAWLSSRTKSVIQEEERTRQAQIWGR